MNSKLKVLSLMVPAAALIVVGFQNCASSKGAGAADQLAPPNSAQAVCPDNFVQVVGNAAFGTTNFCISKYEAKSVNNLPESTADGTP